MATQSVSFTELEAAAKPASNVETQATTTATQTTEQVAAATPQFTEADAQSLRELNALGINPQNAQQFIQAKNALDNLPVLLKSNPKVVLAEIAKSDPEAYNAILEATSDEWFEKYQREHPDEFRPTNGSPSRTATSATDPRVTQLQGQLASLIAERNQEKSDRQQTTMVNNYNKAIDDLKSKLPDTVVPAAKKYAEMRTKELIWADPAARDRVAKGIYVDVPTYFAKASAEATADFKAAANTEHTNRAAVEARGAREIVPAAENTNGTQAAPHEDPVWGDASIARDVAQALKAMK